MRALVVLLVLAAGVAGGNGLLRDSGPTNETLERYATPAHEPVRGPDYFGVNASYLYWEWVDQELHLDQMASFGFGTARYHPLWHLVEPAPPDEEGNRAYRWGRADEVFARASAHGVRIYVNLAYGARWAAPESDDEGDWKTPPEVGNHHHFAAYAGAVAARYGRDGSFWAENPDLPYLPVTTYEVWNEPNLDRFWHGANPKTTPGEYANLYLRSHRRIREVDPRARLVTGGLAPSGRSVSARAFLRGMFAARPELRRLVTHVGYHPYGFRWRKTIARLREIRRTLDRHGSRSMQIEINEDGVTTGTGRFGDSQRGEYLRRAITRLPRSDCRVSHYGLHSWITAEEGGDNRREDFFGIVDAEAAPKFSGQQAREALRMMRGLSAEQPPRRTLRHCYR